MPDDATTTPISTARLEYIEEIGLFFGALGLPRMAGRVLGALLVADPPEQSAEELALTLQASRGSISTSTRLLEATGIIDRVSKPGERKMRFRNRPGAWGEVMKRRMAAVGAFRALAERGLGVLSSDDPEVRRGLEEMRDFMAYWEAAFPRLFADWEEVASARGGTAGKETGSKEKEPS